MDYNLMFDACLAYNSFGALADMAEKGISMPSHWGLDAEGKPSTDPTAVMKGTRLPIGGHKGFGLTILGELLTGLISNGQIIDEPQPETGDIGMPTHTAICFDVGGLIGSERFRARTSELIDRMQSRAPGLTIPGQRSYQNKAKAAAEGVLEIDAATIDKLNECCANFGLKSL
jgi:LDH2 family malate/lactate/ureidoglycolate dehydrogenase